MPPDRRTWPGAIHKDVGHCRAKSSRYGLAFWGLALSTPDRGTRSIWATHRRRRLAIVDEAHDVTVKADVGAVLAPRVGACGIGRRGLQVKER